MLMTFANEGFTTNLSCEGLLSGTESPVHCISCFSLELFHTPQHDNCSPLISTTEQQEHHLSAKQQTTYVEESYKLPLNYSGNFCNEGSVAWKPLNADPGLKFYPSINFSSIKMSFTYYACVV